MEAVGALEVVSSVLGKLHPAVRITITRIKIDKRLGLVTISHQGFTYSVNYFG